MQNLLAFPDEWYLVKKLQLDFTGGIIACGQTSWGLVAKILVRHAGVLNSHPISWCCSAAPTIYKSYKFTLFLANFTLDNQRPLLFLSNRDENKAKNIISCMQSCKSIEFEYKKWPIYITEASQDRDSTKPAKGGSADNITNVIGMHFHCFMDRMLQLAFIVSMNQGYWYSAVVERLQIFPAPLFLPPLVDGYSTLVFFNPSVAPSDFVFDK